MKLIKLWDKKHMKSTSRTFYTLLMIALMPTLLAMYPSGYIIGAATTAPNEENAGTQMMVNASRGKSSVPTAFHNAAPLLP